MRGCLCFSFLGLNKAGCDAVIHIANVVQLKAKDPVKEIIEPSVNGLRTVLTSIEKEPKVKVLILTSRFERNKSFFCLD
jgi:hypothetical protein